MSNSYRTTESVRARNAMLAAGKFSTVPAPVPVQQYPDGARPFTVDDWREEQRSREWTDMFRMSIRWKITVRLLGDQKPWNATLCGEHDEVLKRVQTLFRNPLSVTLEPAGVGGEISDSWLTPIVTRSA